MNIVGNYSSKFLFKIVSNTLSIKRYLIKSYEKYT